MSDTTQDITAQDITAQDMTAQQAGAASGAPDTTPAKPKKKDDGFFLFLIKLVAVVLIFRSFIFAPFSIPSESMLPALENGDYLLAAKWPYGYSKYSLPFDAPLIPGRILSGLPEHGDVVIFKHPVDGSDYIKRAIGLPGDTIEMRNGELFINDAAVKKERIADFAIPVSPNTSCAWGAAIEMQPDGSRECVYARFRETLPSGRTYNVLDFGPTPQDNFGPIVVPDGHIFVMGDNRDNSQDSRFPATPGGGVGMVAEEDLVGRATVIMWSTDGGAEWIKPWTWFTAARWGRIGSSL